MFQVFFFNDTATTEIYTLSLHDALPISRPGHGQPADERTLTEQVVGHADSLAAGQPCRDEGVDALQPSRVDDHRATRYDHHYAALRRRADPVDRQVVGVREHHRLRRPEYALVAWVESPAGTTDVAEALRIRRLTDDHDADGLARDGRRGILRERDVALGELTDSVEDRRPRDHVGRAALPGQRPAAGLVADVVGVATGDVDVPVAADRQRALAVL